LLVDVFMADVVSNFHIVLVEDNDDHALLIRLALEDRGLVVSIDRLSDGEQAVNYIQRVNGYARRQHPDLILLDINLPKMNGHEVLDNIRADEELTGVPVVMLTTSDSESDLEQAYKQHVNSYLVKPADASMFQTMVHDLHQYWAVWNQKPADAS
jgi:CheY-like chemotaxis protein